MREHRLERYSRREATVLRQLQDSVLQQYRDEGIIVGALAVRSLDDQRVLIYPRLIRSDYII